MANSLPWTPLHDRVHRSIRQRSLFRQKQRLLVAVSGGQDSLCLIRLLLDLQPKWHWEIAVAHCNHRWRSDSTQNAEYVAQLSKSWCLPHYCITAEDNINSEAAARQWRYDTLGNLAVEKGYASVVTGHTGSDRAETLLYNLIRGSGADGLQALTWQRELTPRVELTRPLLDISRYETAQFCHDMHLQVWEDTTNQDWHYARNRIRQELLPYLQTHFNPKVEQSLAQTAELLRAEVAYLETVAEELRIQATLQTAGSSQTTEQRLDRRILKTAPLALQRRVMRQTLLQFLPVAPSFEHVEKLTALIKAPNRTCTDPFPGGAIATVEGDWILIKKI